MAGGPGRQRQLAAALDRLFLIVTLDGCCLDRYCDSMVLVFFFFF